MSGKARPGAGNRERSEQCRRDRFPLMRVVRYERCAAILPERGRTRPVDDRDGLGLTVNVSTGGLCLIIDRAPVFRELMRVQVPMPGTLVRTPTLAEVRWVRPVRLREDSTGDSAYFVGLQFML